VGATVGRDLGAGLAVRIERARPEAEEFYRAIS